MTVAELRELAKSVRNGEVIDWASIADAMALDQAADDQEFADEISERWTKRIDNLEESEIANP